MNVVEIDKVGISENMPVKRHRMDDNRLISGLNT